MTYAQIKGGLKLHLVYEAGEGPDRHNLIPVGHVSNPLCGAKVSQRGYKMTINMPLGNACKNCLRVFRTREDRHA